MKFWLIVLLCLVAVNARAETAQERAGKLHDQIIQQQRAIQENEEQERERRMRERPPLVSPIAPPIAEEIESSTKCFTINRITIEGSTKLSESEQKNLVSDSLNKCLNVAALKTLVHKITANYFDAGYVTTQVFIPSQNLKSGTLIIRVVEGIVEAIEFEDSSSSNLWFSKIAPAKIEDAFNFGSMEKKLESFNRIGNKLQIVSAFPVKAGSVLNLRDIEQGLDQMNRVASNRVTMKLIPGSQEASTRIVLSNSSLSPLRIIGTYDNSGNYGTGVYSGRLMTELDNVFRINDSWYFSRSKPLSNGNGLKKSESYAFGVSIPYGYWTFSENSNRGTYRVPQYDTDGTFFTTSGFSETHLAKLDRVIERSANTKTSLYTSLTARNSESYFNDVIMSDKDVRLSIAGFGATHMHRIGKTVLNISGEYSKGLTLLNARKDLKNAEIGSSQAQFEKISGTANIYHPFSKNEFPLTLRSQMTAQYSPDTLYSTERISMGDLYSVRGFKEQSLQGDSGIYVHNDVSYTFTVPWEKDSLRETFGDIQPFIGFDAGQARVQGGKPNNFGQGEGTMSGASLGVRNTGSRINMQLSYSEPIKSPSFIEKKDREIYLSVTVKTW